MTVLVAPLLLRALPPGTSIGRRSALAGAVLFGALAADLDIPIGFLAGGNGFVAHGGYTHSLLMAMVFATIFLLWVRLLAPVHVGRAWAVGALAYGSHLMLDAINHGRGIMLLWPLSTERFVSPVRIFYGVRHSDLSDWTHHLITLATELIFVAIVLIVARPLYLRRQQPRPVPP